jgi:hypothetical protein
MGMMKLTADDVECNLAVRRLPDGRTWLELAEEVCARRGAMLSEVLGRSHRNGASGVRQEVWHELKAIKVARYSFDAIAVAFDRDHATVRVGIMSHRERTARERVRLSVVERMKPLVKVSA